MRLKGGKISTGDYYMKITCPSCKRRMKLQRGEKRQCRCGNWLDYRSFFRLRTPYDVYLLDANIMIYAKDNPTYQGEMCRKILSVKTASIHMGTTTEIIKEIGPIVKKQLPETIHIYKSGKLLRTLERLKATGFKQPSQADLSLIQAAIEHPEIHGIITYDQDFNRIATAGFVEKHSSRKFLIINAAKFIKKFNRSLK